MRWRQTWIQIGRVLGPGLGPVLGPALFPTLGRGLGPLCARTWARYLRLRRRLETWWVGVQRRSEFSRPPTIYAAHLSAGAAHCDTIGLWRPGLWQQWVLFETRGGAPGQSLYLAYAPRRRAHCMSGIPLVHGVGSQSLARSMEGADHHVGISGLGARCVRLCPDSPQCSGTICGSIAVSVSASVPVDAALACAVAPSGTLECHRPCPARAYFR